MATLSLQATPREGSGKGVARKIRGAGLVPAVIYRDGGTPTHITLDPNELALGFKRTGNRNTIVEITVADAAASHRCLVKDVQRHPVNLNILHLDFYEIQADEEVRVMVPVSTSGKAAGVTAGGKLRVMVRDLPVVCKPDDIPDHVDVDVTELEIGRFIKVSEIPAPSGCRIDNLREFNVVTVAARRGAVEVAEDDDAAAEAS